MNKLEYIPGDLCIVKGKIESVCEVDRDNDFSITTDQHPFIRLSEVKPIFLTPEILEKNGWFEDSFLDSYKSFYKNDRNYPSLHGQQTKDGYIYDVDFGEETIITNIKYVHQLQHLLFGLGLSMDLKV